MRVVHSPYGQVLKAIRDNEPRAVSLVDDVARYNLLAFVISSRLAGLAGSLKTLVLGFATLSDAHWSLSGEVGLMTLLGGMGTFDGPVIWSFTFVFFFQAEDGIRDLTVTGVQTCALPILQLLADFEPRLVGPVLAGTATEHSDIQLHLFAERAESITIRLMDLGIDHEVVERRVRYGVDRVVAYPGVHFEFDDQVVDATVFPVDGIRQAPVSPVDGKPMRRIDAEELEVLLDAEDAPSRAQ